MLDNGLVGGLALGTGPDGPDGPDGQASRVYLGTC